jgi:two-component system cell cycle response regulator DivK
MSKTVLIVEDDRLCMKFLTDLMRHRRHTVIGTNTGEEALVLARAHTPDILVLDVCLSSELTGVDVVRLMKSDVILRPIPILIVTAFAMHDEAARISTCGCDGFMTKPVPMFDFIEAVERLSGSFPRPLDVARIFV